MFAHITQLRYWKSEHEEATCEDACSADCARGLFAVADGAGTTLFSNIWAEILAAFFVEVPLLSEDPFEVEWWVRQVQGRYKQREPVLAQIMWNAWQKMQSQGSHATLATLRIARSEQAAAQAELLVFGDSCVLIHKAGAEQVESFPLKQVADFDRAPICIPSKSTLFNRYFHRCTRRSITLEAGDSVMLATDAVARWIVSGGAGRYTPREAFEAVSNQTVHSWPSFVQLCRELHGMVDDDSTVLLLGLQDEEIANACQLGTTAEHSHEQREQRKCAFERAVEEQNRELAAIAYGDGIDLALEGVYPPQEEIDRARQVADALREIRDVLRRELNGPAVVARVGTVWAKYAALLETEPCAAGLRQVLAQIGVGAPASAASGSADAITDPQPTQLIHLGQLEPVAPRTVLAGENASVLSPEQQDTGITPRGNSSREDTDLPHIL